MKKSAKFASPMAIAGLADFESKLDSVNQEDGNFTDSIDSYKSVRNMKPYTLFYVSSFALVFSHSVNITEVILCLD